MNSNLEWIHYLRSYCFCIKYKMNGVPYSKKNFYAPEGTINMLNHGTSPGVWPHGNIHKWILAEVVSHTTLSYTSLFLGTKDYLWPWKLILHLTFTPVCFSIWNIFHQFELFAHFHVNNHAKSGVRYAVTFFHAHPNCKTEICNYKILYFPFSSWVVG